MTAPLPLPDDPRPSAGPQSLFLALRRRFGQGLPPAGGWKRHMVDDGQERLYTQADLDFFSANADEYFATANALRLERERLRETLEEIVGIADDHPFPFTTEIVRLGQGALYGG